MEGMEGMEGMEWMAELFEVDGFETSIHDNCGDAEKRELRSFAVRGAIGSNLYLYSGVTLSEPDGFPYTLNRGSRSPRIRKTPSIIILAILPRAPTGRIRPKYSPRSAIFIVVSSTN